MNYHITEKNTIESKHPLIDYITNILKNSSIDKIFDRTGGIACLYNDKKTILYDNSKSKYIYFFESNDMETLLYYLQNFVNYSPNEIKISYDLINIFEKLSVNERDLYRLFNIIKWPSSKKGLDFYNALKEMPQDLRQNVFDKKLSLNDAYYLHNNIKTNYINFSNALPDKMTFSQKSKIIKYAAEYCLKNNCYPDDLIKHIDDNKDLVNVFFELRYPLYSNVKKRFNDFTESFGFNKFVKIDYNNSFENEQYTLSISFKNIEDLKNKTKTIAGIIDKKIKEPNFIDYFDHSNLFDEINNE